MKTAHILSTLVLCAVPALSGCVSTVTKVVTAPVRVTGKAVDMATTSQSEADERRGRQMRESDGRHARLERQYERHMRQCDAGDESACLKARDDYAEIQQIPSAAYTPR